MHYLSPYSSDLIPIENAFIKLKAHVRKTAARTLDALEQAAANACTVQRTIVQISPLTPDATWIRRNP